jgi:hypothetical protein
MTSPQTELRIFWGGSTLSNTPDLSIPGPYVNDYTLQHSGRIGDVNGDGFEDIALSAFSDGGSNGGVVQIFAGGSRPGTSPSTSVATDVGSYGIVPVGDVDADGYDDFVTVVPGTAYYLFQGASKLPTSFAGSWTDAAVAAGVGMFDIDSDGFADFLIGRGAGSPTPPPVLYRGTAGGPTAISGGLAQLHASETIGVSDNDGDGRPDIVGGSGQSGTAVVEWAGSDGTTAPRSARVLLSDQSAQLSGQIAR